MKVTFTLPDNLPEMTLKNLLEEQLLIPRKIRHFLRTKKHITINQKHLHWQEMVYPGDECQLLFDEEDYPEKTIPWGDPRLVELVYQDEHLIVVNKPHGMKTHGNTPHELGLLNHVSAFCQQTCFVVHRLDMETSGLILFAKSPFILPIINRLLEKREIKRQYWALVDGSFPQKTAVFRDKIGRDRHDKRKRVVSYSHGQKAETHVQVLKRFQGQTLVNCQLQTGRTHQIRVHLSHHHHPILGDPLYHPKSSTPRLMLHAHRLSFTHPLTLETITLNAISPSFEACLNKVD